MPNVTAIDWKQADVFGPSFEQKGGMSHGFRLMPPFLLFRLLLPASRWRGDNQSSRFLLNGEADETPATWIISGECP